MKRILALLTILLILVGCSTTPTSNSREVTDSMGNVVEIPGKVEKIISTAPSNTEILVDLGLADKIIGVDEWSLGIEGLSSETQSVGVTKGDAEKLLALEPDLVVASGINFASGEDPYTLLKESGIAVVYLSTPETAQGIIDDIKFVADVTNATQKGDELVKELETLLKDVSEIGSKITDKKKVYFEIGSVPALFTQGDKTFINDFINLIGAQNIFADQEYWFSPSVESILEANPDIIFTNEDYLPTSVEDIKNRDGFSEVNAVKNNEVYLLNVNESSRATARAFNILKEMAELIYPDQYDF